MQFDEVLATFAAFFDRERIGYALIGGLALQALGYSRFTRDADFAVDGASRERVVTFAASLGYETLHVSEGYSNHLDPGGRLGRIDFMYVHGETARQVLGSAVLRPVIGTLALPVAHPTHLAAMKALAMKNAPARVLVDSPDVKFLLGHPETDRAAVRDYFARHGLLELFDAIDRNR